MFNIDRVSQEINFLLRSVFDGIVFQLLIDLFAISSQLPIRNQMAKFVHLKFCHVEIS